MTYNTMTRDELRAAYVAKIGYDPFEDDPSITEAEVAAILVGHDKERAEHATDAVAYAVVDNKAMALAAGWCGSKLGALDAFLLKKSAMDEALAELQALSADHFGVHPDAVTWGDVASIGEACTRVCAARDWLTGKGEFAR